MKKSKEGFVGFLRKVPPSGKVLPSGEKRTEFVLGQKLEGIETLLT